MENAVDIARLCRAVPRPSLQFSFQLGIGTNEIMLGDDATWPEQIAMLRKALQKSPKDTAARFRLARLLQAQESDNSKETSMLFSQVERETSAALRKTPSNIELLLRLGFCQHDQKRDADAEKTLRQAVALAPNDWRTHNALADTLSGRNLAGLTDDKALQEKLTQASQARDLSTLASLTRQLFQRNIAPERLATLRRRSAEALACYERAISLAPRQAEPVINRLLFQAFGSADSLEKLAAPDNEEAVQSLVKNVFSTEYIAALKLAQESSPDNPKIIVVGGCLEFFHSLMANPSVQLDDPASFAKLPDAQKVSIRKGLARLRTLQKTGSRTMERRILEYQAYLTFFTGDTAGAQALFR
jgi:tetratricopeptide (TPR) repeat protein